MSVNVQYVNQKLADESRAYFDTKNQSHIVSAELVEYRDARVAVMLKDEIPVCGFMLLAKNSDDAIKEIQQYLWATCQALKKDEDLVFSSLVYLQDKLYYLDRIFQEDD